MTVGCCREEGAKEIELLDPFLSVHVTLFNHTHPSTVDSNDFDLPALLSPFLLWHRREQYSHFDLKTKARQQFCILVFFFSFPLFLIQSLSCVGLECPMQLRMAFKHLVLLLLPS